MSHDEVLLEARFDEKLKLYWFVNGLWIMVISFIGWPLIPFWVLGLGQFLSAKRYENLKAHLTPRTLYIRQGYLVKVEKHVPLDRIQDLSLREGPILRMLGLAALTVETAGQSQQGVPDANLAGLVEAPAFRDAVLAQRERLVHGEEAGAAAGGAAATAAADRGLGPSAGATEALLADIRDTLRRIEERLPPPGT